MENAFLCGIGLCMQAKHNKRSERSDKNVGGGGSCYGFCCPEPRSCPASGLLQTNSCLFGSLVALTPSLRWNNDRPHLVEGWEGKGCSPCSSVVYCSHLRVSLSERWCRWVATRAWGEISHLAALWWLDQTSLLSHTGSKLSSLLISLSPTAIIRVSLDQSRLLQLTSFDASESHDA